ncbi:MAG: plasmid pRiA4b ORF-3 family protein [Candidatus Methanomethylophilaceae archaeon]
MRAFKLKMVLRGSNPKITRTVAIPENASFRDLHLTIQAVMGWYDYHLHVFMIGGTEIGDPEEDFEDEMAIPLSEYEGTKILYNYDFGDDWEIEITWLKTIDNYGKTTPTLLKWTENSPPEDSGGIYGYNRLLEDASNPDSEDHEDALEWLEGNDFDEEYVKEALDIMHVQGAIDDDEIMLPYEARIAIISALSIFTDEPLVFDLDDMIPRIVKDSPPRKSKRRAPENGPPKVKPSEVELNPERYIHLAEPGPERLPKLFREFKELYPETDWSTVGNEDNLVDVSKTIVENALDEEFSDFIVNSMAEYSMTWARENGLFFSEETESFEGLDDFMAYLEENGVDMDDPVEVEKAFRTFTGQ